MSGAPDGEGPDRRGGVRRGDLLASLWRTFAVHGSWNHRTLLGTGLAYALLPVLRRVHAGDPVARRRALQQHLETFNAHPYLAAVAAGALAREEADGTDRETIRRLRTGLAGSLGSLGDRAVWCGWRPFCLLVGMAAYVFGATAVGAATSFLVLYNAGHVWMRVRGFRTGWEAGRAVGGAIRDSVLARATRVLRPVNGALLGLVGYGLIRTAAETALPSAAGIGGLALVTGVMVLCALAAFRWPVAARRVAPFLLAAAPAAGWLLG